MSPFIRDTAQDLLGDLSILADRAWCLQNWKDRLERVSVNARHTINLLDASTGMSVHPIAGRCPVGPGFVNILAGDQAFDFLEMIANMRRLTQPTRLFPVQGGGDRQ
jgi:hypothetical protein